jgi:hypothetical protein
MGAVPDYKTCIEELNKADAEVARLRDALQYAEDALAAHGWKQTSALRMAIRATLTAAPSKPPELFLIEAVERLRAENERLRIALEQKP